MNFDVISFICGLAIAAFIARLILRSEDQSVANRIAYNLMLDAQNSIKLSYMKYTFENPTEDFIAESKIYPVEDKDFLIQSVPDLTVQTDVNIDSYYSVYTKQYDLWFLIEESYGCETMRRRYAYYASNARFEKGKLIGTPYDFNLAKHFS